MTTKLSKLSQALQEFSLPELEMFQEPMAEADHEMLMGLAQVYANAGFRKYLTNQYLKAMKATALATSSMEDICIGRGRILTLKELLGKAKEAYEQLDRINQLTGKPK